MAQPSSISPTTAERPLLEMLKIAAPTVATMTSYTLMQFVDKLMCSRISDDPIWVGSQGNGGLAAWVPISIVMGSLFVINSFVSQNLGAGKPEKTAAYCWNGLWICLAAWVVLIPYGMGLGHIFEWIRTTDGATAEELERLARRDELATGYGQILIYGAGITMCTRAISQFFYGLHKPGVVLMAGLLGNLTNLGLNYCLIYGNFGFPAMELRGAAIATVIGTGVEFLLPFAIFFWKLNPTHHTRAAWRPSWAHIKDLAKVGWPGGAMFGNEMICWSIFMVYLVGSFGPDHSTAGWIAHQWMTLSFMPAVGISIAVTAVVGKQIGAGKPEEAARRAKLGLLLAMIYMGFCGICFILFRKQMVNAFIDDGTDPAKAAFLISMGGKFLIATAAFQLGDAIAMVLSGALRGAGDTVWIGVVTVALSWTLIVGGGVALVRFAPQLESVGPWIAAAAYILALATAVGWRFASGKWKSMSLVRKDAPISTH